MLEDYKAEQTPAQEIITLLDGEAAKIKDVAVRERIEPIRKEIAAELNLNTLGRLKPLLDNVADPQLAGREAVAGHQRLAAGRRSPQLVKLKFPWPSRCTRSANWSSSTWANRSS